MNRRTSLRTWAVLATVVLLSGGALWLAATSDGGSAQSPVPTATPGSAPEQGTSPLVPSPMPPAAPSSWAGIGAALLWTAVGIVLALGIAFAFVRASQ